VCWC